MPFPAVPLPSPVPVGYTPHNDLHTDISDDINYLGSDSHAAGLFLASPSAAPGAADFRVITAADIATALGAGTGSIVITAPGTLTVSSDTDVSTILGRTRIDSRAADTANFSHFDFTAGTDYALRQLSTGTTIVNAPTGQTVSLRVNASQVVAIAAASVTLSQILVVLSDTDATTVLGRIRLSSPTTDEANFSHFDQTAAANYALKQTSAGTTSVNAPTGQTVVMRINNVAIETIAGTQVTYVQPVDVQALLRCDSFQLDQTPTAETPTPTHTFTISLDGTTYRIPCLV